MSENPAGTAAPSGARPTGPRNRVTDLPVWCYRRGLGFLFGARLVMLVHRARRSDVPRHTTLEVLQHRAVDGEYQVLSGWGRFADWFRDIEADPYAELWVGSSRHRVEHRVLGPADAVAAVRAHLLARRRESARMHPTLWRAQRASDAALARLLEPLPVVAFRPVGPIAGTRRERALVGRVGAWLAALRQRLPRRWSIGRGRSDPGAATRREGP